MTTTKPTYHLIGAYAPSFDDDNESDVTKPVNVSKHIPDLDEMLLSYQFNVCANKDYTKIYTNGVNVSYYSKPWGITASTDKLDKLVTIEYFNENEIKIKRLFTQPASECLFVLTDDDNVYGMSDSPEVLGLGFSTSTKLDGPRLIPALSALSNIVDIKAGEYCSIALCKSDDKTANIIISFWIRIYDLPNEIGALIMKFIKLSVVYSTDFSGYGENGHGAENSDFKHIWKEVTALRNIDIIQISTGNNHTLFLDSAGMVWSCGANSYRQTGLSLGKGDVPTIIEYFKDNDIEITKIDSGCNHNLALDSLGRVYSWGNNENGECGFCTIENDDDEDCINIPRLIVFKEKEIVIEDIGCGAFHSWCKSTENKHYLFGQNGDYECLLLENTNNIETPICINKILEELYPDKSIASVKLGYETTCIKLI